MKIKKIAAIGVALLTLIGFSSSVFSAEPKSQSSKKGGKVVVKKNGKRVKK